MLPVPEDNAAHIAHTAAIHEYLTGGTRGLDLAGFSGQLEDGADFTDEDVLGVHTHGLSQLAVDLQHTLLTVDGQEELGPDQTVDDLQLLLAGMSGNMETFALFVNHVSTFAVQLVDDSGNGLFVSGDGGSGNDDPVAGGDVHLLVGVEGHPVQGGHVFTLAAGGDDDHLVLGQALGGGQIHNGAGLDLQIPQLLGNLQHILHAAACDGHLAAMLLGGIQNGLDPVHVGGKGGDDDSLVAVAELTVETLCHDVFAGGVAAALHVGGVCQQGQNALGAQLAESCQVDHAVLGGGIDLEVAGEDDHAHRGMDS